VPLRRIRFIIPMDKQMLIFSPPKTRCLRNSQWAKSSSGSQRREFTALTNSNYIELTIHGHTVCCRCYSADDGRQWCGGLRLRVRRVFHRRLLHSSLRSRRRHVHRSARLCSAVRRLRFHTKPVDRFAGANHSGSVLFVNFFHVRFEH